MHAHCLRRWLGHRSDIQFPLLSARQHAVCEVCQHPYTLGALCDKVEYNNPWRRRCDALCTYLVTVEACLLLFLFVLAAMGHALFVLGMYGCAESKQYSLQRVGLAVVNAVLTFSWLVLVQRIVSRCLRESDFLLALASAPLTGDVEAAVTIPTTGEGRPCGFVAQLILGACLSLLAAAEIFFLFRHLPFSQLI